MLGSATVRELHDSPEGIVVLLSDSHQVVGHGHRAAPEIEITPEMIEAGRAALDENKDVFFDCGGAGVESEMVSEIYAAMLKAATHPPAGKR